MILSAHQRRSGKSAGQALVEFAVTLPILLLLILGVVEFGRLLQSWVTIHHAAEEAAHYATTGTGFDLGAGVRESQIVSVARGASTGLIIDAAASQSDPGYFHVTIRSSRSGPDPLEPDDAGGANDFVRIDVVYNHPFLLRLINDMASHVALSASSLVVNERFARPTGQIGELPPTPVPTWTPTPTPTPVPTSTPTP